MTLATPTGDGSRARSDWKNCTVNGEASLEAAIAAAYQLLIAAPSWDEKLERWREMVRLIDQVEHA